MKMKYLTLAATAVAIVISSGDVKAACDTWFNGKEKCTGSKLSADYWTCRTLYATGWGLCRGMALPPESDAKIKKSCAPGANPSDCQTAIQDVAHDIQALQQENFAAALQKAKKGLDDEIEGEAKALTAK